MPKVRIRNLFGADEGICRPHGSKEGGSSKEENS